MLDALLKEMNITNEAYEDHKKKIIDTSEMIIFLGNHMVYLLDQDKLICQGMLRLSIKDHYNRKTKDLSDRRTPKYLSVDQWINLIINKLGPRLEKIRIEDYDEVIKSIVKIFLTYQSFVKH